MHVNLTYLVFLCGLDTIYVVFNFVEAFIKFLLNFY
jgi:hypothetical protein